MFSSVRSTWEAVIIFNLIHKEIDFHQHHCLFFGKNNLKKLVVDFNAVAYTQSEAIYRWNKDRQIVIASGMKMSQFDLVSAPVSNYTISFKHGTESKNKNNGIQPLLI